VFGLAASILVAYATTCSTRFTIGKPFCSDPAQLGAQVGLALNSFFFVAGAPNRFKIHDQLRLNCPVAAGSRGTALAASIFVAYATTRSTRFTMVSPFCS
jgi:hypothetical protein